MGLGNLRPSYRWDRTLTWYRHSHRLGQLSRKCNLHRLRASWWKGDLSRLRRRISRRRWKCHIISELTREIKVLFRVLRWRWCRCISRRTYRNSIISSASGWPWRTSMPRRGAIALRSSRMSTPRTIARTQEWPISSTRMLTHFPHVAGLSRLAWGVTSYSQPQNKKEVKKSVSKQSKNRLLARNLAPYITHHVYPCLTVRKRQISRAKIDSNSLGLPDLIEKMKNSA